MTERFGSNGKSLANLVMAIASYTDAKSTVEYSLSPLYNYQYSSIGKLFERLLKVDKGDISIFSGLVESFIKDFNPQFSGIIKTQLDTLPVYKPHSPTHPDRSAVYKPNLTIQGNKPVEVGYNISSLNQGFDIKWSIPLSLKRVPIQDKSIKVGQQQLITFLKTIDQEHCFVVNTGDSSYGCAGFLSQLYEYENLVNIVRLKNRNIYDYSPQGDTNGANKIYGKVYNLRRLAEKSNRKNPKTKELSIPKTSIFEKQPDAIDHYFVKTHKGRQVKVELKLFHQMSMRSQNGNNMKHKVFDVVVVDYLETETLKPIHQKPIYLAVCGKKRNDITLLDAYKEHYGHRYDIEPNNRFMKHQLGLGRFQTPIQEHFDLFLPIIQLVEWLLLLASSEVKSSPQKWQKYNEKPILEGQRLSIAQTRKSCQPFF